MRARTKKYRDKKMSKAAMAQFVMARIQAVADANTPIDTYVAATIMEKIQGAMECIRLGKGTIEHCALLSSQVSVTMRLCECDVAGSGQYLQIALGARDALEAMGHRNERTGKWGFDGPGLQALNDWIELREALLFHEENTVGIEELARDSVYQQVAAGNCLRFGGTKAGGA